MSVSHREVLLRGNEGKCAIEVYRIIYSCVYSGQSCNHVSSNLVTVAYVITLSSFGGIALTPQIWKTYRYYKFIPVLLSFSVGMSHTYLQCIYLCKLTYTFKPIDVLIVRWKLIVFVACCELFEWFTDKGCKE